MTPDSPASTPAAVRRRTAVEKLRHAAGLLRQPRTGETTLAAVAMLLDQVADELQTRATTLGLIADDIHHRPTADTTSLDLVRLAVMQLPAACRYHGSRLDPDSPHRDACCDTGRPSLLRRQALTALTRLTTQDPT